MNSKLTSSIKSKVVLQSKTIDGVDYFDVGVCVAKYISQQKDDKWLSLKTLEYINQVFEELNQIHPEYGNIKAISNIGILLKPTLKIDIVKLLNDNISNNNFLVLCQGVVMEDRFFFMTQKDGKQIDINDLKHIIL